MLDNGGLLSSCVLPLPVPACLSACLSVLLAGWPASWMSGWLANTGWGTQVSPRSIPHLPRHSLPCTGQHPLTRRNSHHCEHTHTHTHRCVQMCMSCRRRNTERAWSCYCQNHTTFLILNCCAYILNKWVIKSIPQHNILFLSSVRAWIWIKWCRSV